MCVRSWLIACTASVSAAAAAAQDVRPTIGPFVLGSTVDEAKRAAPNAKWEMLADKTTGRLNAVSAANVWSLDKSNFRLTLRPNDYGTRLLKFESDEPAASRDECQRRAIAVIAHLEVALGEFGPGPSSLGWGFGDATVGAGDFSQLAVTEEFGDSYWQAETLTIEKPHYVAVSASFFPATENCEIDIAATTELPSSRGLTAKSSELADRVEGAFIAEFKDADAARAAWRRGGRPWLEAVADQLFPTPVPQEFAAEVTAAVRARRAAEPQASIEALVTVALNPRGNGIEIVLPDKPKAKGAAPMPAAEVVFQKLKDGAVLKIPTLVEKTVAQVRDALVEMPERLIIDLRGNTGGDFDTITRVAESLLQPTAVVVTVVSHEGISDYITPGPAGTRRKAAFVVLVDEETNAGALALAAALVDHTKAKVAGKLAARVNGTVTSVRSLPPEKGKPRVGSIRYPTGVLKRPNGALLADGLKVDLPITATGDAAIAEAMKAFK